MVCGPGLVRCEDLAGVDTAARDLVATLRTREQKLVAQAARGADISGPLAELEARAALAERDLIVQVSQRRTLDKGRADARATMATLELREPTLHQLADRCRREIAHPPKLAVPDVSRLGEVPDTRTELDAFVDRLAAVGRAFDAVADAYSAPAARARGAALPAGGRPCRGRRERPQRLPDGPLRATTRPVPSSPRHPVTSP